jgi:hypothetical protein
MARTKQFRLEADHAFDQAKVYSGISASKMRKLLLDGVNLLQVVQKFDVVGDNKSFSQMDNTGGNTAVVLTRLPVDLKGAVLGPTT